MNKSLLEIYALSICFVSIGCMSIFGGVLLFTIAEQFLPVPSEFPPMHYPPPIYMQHGTGSVHVDAENLLPRIANQVSENNRKISADKMAEEQKKYEKTQMERIKVEAIRSTIRYIIILIVASFVFIFHWRMAKMVRLDNDT